MSNLIKNKKHTLRIKRDRKGASAVLLGLIILVSTGIFLSFTYTSWLKDIVESYGDYEYLRIFRTQTIKYTETNTFVDYEPYGYVIPIIIDYSLGTEDLVDYALSIEITNPTIFSHANPDGSDVFFVYEYQPQFTYIPHWIEFWDSEHKKARIWVKISIEAGEIITIYMHYGVDPPDDLPSWQPEDVFIFFEDFNEPTVDETKWYIPDKYKDKNKYEIVDGEIRMYEGDITGPGDREKQYFWMDTQNYIDYAIAVGGKIALENFTSYIMAGVELVENHDEWFDIEIQNPKHKAILAKLELDKKTFTKSIIIQNRNNVYRESVDVDLSEINWVRFEVKYGISWISIWDNLTDTVLSHPIDEQYQVPDYYLRIGARPEQGYVAYDYIFYRYVVSQEPVITIGAEENYYLQNIREEEVVRSWKVRFKLKNQGKRDITLVDIIVDGKPFTTYSQIVNVTAIDVDAQKSYMLYDSTSNKNMFDEDGFKIPSGSIVWIEIFIVPGEKFHSGRSIEFTFLSFKGHHAIKTIMLP